MIELQFIPFLERFDLAPRNCSLQELPRLGPREATRFDIVAATATHALAFRVATVERPQCCTVRHYLAICTVRTRDYFLRSTVLYCTVQFIFLQFIVSNISPRNRVNTQSESRYTLVENDIGRLQYF